MLVKVGVDAPDRLPSLPPLCTSLTNALDLWRSRGLEPHVPSEDALMDGVDAVAGSLIQSEPDQ